MHARVTISSDVNIVALYRMLAENGLYLVKVHNGRIVEMAKVPRGTKIEELPILRDDDEQHIVEEREKTPAVARKRKAAT